MDIGCGRGQDLNKYAFAGFGNLICIDSDKDAIHELVTRKLGSKNIKYPAIETVVADMS